MSAPPRFDAVIHAPPRLQICAILSAADETEFATLRDDLEISDSVLSKHLKQLDEAGYVALRKAPFGGRQRTWISLTRAGRKALAGHLAELERLVASAKAGEALATSPEPG